MGDGAGKTAYELGLDAGADDLTGMQFGAASVVRYYGKSKRGKPQWVCLCKCGKIFAATSKAIQNEVTKHDPVCTLPNANLRHGMSKTKEYRAWSGVLSRTLNPNYSAYSYYGGRGIGVCDRWRQSFEAFYEDMGPAPSNEHSVDRIDSNGDYEPGNCRWATKSEQARNTRKTIVLEFKGQTKCLAEWAEEYGIDHNVVRSRLVKCRWSIEKALTTPVQAPQKRE